MREIQDDIQRWLARGDRIALATVVATRRSAPRPIGAKLAISVQGELAGSVSGGCVEHEVYEYAQEVLAGAPPRLLTYGISDDLALSVGLPCGGEIDVFVEEARRPLAERLMQIVENSERAVVLTVLSGPDLGAELLVTEGGERIGEAPDELAESAPELIRRGRSGVVEVAGREVFADVYGPPPRLLIYGAVDTAEALSRAAQEIGWRPIVADARARFATAERLPSAAEIVVAWPDETLAQVQPDDATAIVILTHDDKFDVPILKQALAGPAYATIRGAVEVTAVVRRDAAGVPVTALRVAHRVDNSLLCAHVGPVVGGEHDKPVAGQALADLCHVVGTAVDAVERQDDRPGALCIRFEHQDVLGGLIRHDVRPHPIVVLGILTTTPCGEERERDKDHQQRSKAPRDGRTSSRHPP